MGLFWVSPATPGKDTVYWKTKFRDLKCLFQFLGGSFLFVILFVRQAVKVLESHQSSTRCFFCFWFFRFFRPHFFELQLGKLFFRLFFPKLFQHMIVLGGHSVPCCFVRICITTLFTSVSSSNKYFRGIMEIGLSFLCLST